MLGLLLIFFIARGYYRLATEYGKSNWGFAILGIATYYASTFLFGFVFGFTMELLSPGTLGSMNNLLIGLITVPFGLLGVWGVYYLLKRTWEGQRMDAEASVRHKDVQ